MKIEGKVKRPLEGRLWGEVRRGWREGAGNREAEKKSPVFKKVRTPSTS